MEILVEKREEFLAPGALPGTVKPRLTITSLIWPPRYYSHFTLAQTKARSVISY